MAGLSMSEMTTYRWSFEEDVHHYCEAGLTAIGVWRQKLSDFGEDRGIELLKDKGMSVSSLQWAGGFTGSDGRSYRESVLDAREALRLAGRLHAPCLIVYSGARAGHTHNHARRLFKSALQELLPFASEFGVSLAIEPMHAGCASEWTFLTDLQETLELIQQLDHAALKLVLDTYHVGMDPALVEQLPATTPHIAIVHLGDAKQPPQGEQNRCRLGEGTLPLHEIFTALTDAGYDGYYDVELMGEEIEASDYDELLRHSKQTFESWSRVAAEESQDGS